MAAIAHPRLDAAEYVALQAGVGWRLSVELIDGEAVVTPPTGGQAASIQGELFMQGQLRVGDLAARLGGDEFAIILPEAGLEEAESAARRVVDSLRASTASGVPRTSVSAGVALIEGSLSPAEVIKLADVALYEAKRAGGDRHALSNPTPEPQVP